MSVQPYPFASALVTGASSGIGEAMVRRLAAAGVPTVVVARRVERLDALAAELPGIEVLAADLGTAAGLKLVTERIKDPTQPVDLVVNNAGFGTSGLFHELDPERLVREVNLNVQALTWLSHAAIRAMTKRDRGWLLNVSSVASFQPAPGLAVYAATKAYVTSLTEALHEELRGTGVHATALCPGLVKTEFQAISNQSGATSKFPAWAFLGVEALVEQALDDTVAGKALSVPGAVYKGLSAASSVAPRWLARRASSISQRLR
jgi:short-subunit dehydrogenase